MFLFVKKYYVLTLLILAMPSSMGAMQRKRNSTSHEQSAPKRRKQHQTTQGLSLLKLADAPTALYTLVDSYLTGKDELNLALTCKAMHGYLYGNQQAKPSLDRSARAICPLLLRDQLDPIGYGLSYACGAEYIKLYGRVIHVATLTNELLQRGQSLTRSILDFNLFDPCTTERPAFYQGNGQCLSIHESVRIPASQQEMLGEWQEIQADGIVNETEFIQQACAIANKETEPKLMMRISNQNISAHCLTQLAQLPVVSLHLTNCLVEGGFGMLAHFQKLRVLTLINCPLPDTLPAELCSLIHLNALTISPEKFCQSLTIGQEFGTMASLCYLDLRGYYSVHFPPEITALNKHLRAVMLDCVQERLIDPVMLLGQVKRFPKPIKKDDEPYTNLRHFFINKIAFLKRKDAIGIKFLPTITNLTILNNTHDKIHDKTHNKEYFRSIKKCKKLTNLRRLTINLEKMHWTNLHLLAGLHNLQSLLICDISQETIRKIVHLDAQLKAATKIFYLILGENVTDKIFSPSFLSMLEQEGKHQELLHNLNLCIKHKPILVALGYQSPFCQTSSLAISARRAITIKSCDLQATAELINGCTINELNHAITYIAKNAQAIANILKMHPEFNDDEQ